MDASAPLYTPGTIVVVRGGLDVAGKGAVGQPRVPSLAKVIRIVGDVATLQRARGRSGQRFQHWCSPIDLPLEVIVREATRRELVLGFPASEGPPLRPVTL